ncbi:MAG: PEP-CTERM sorting domain-containing protein [Leptolyngbya sp. RL_3_1]|nr:PEP-CTERM sorting domain-containing protein [Leptolyngbya sp. RL_3_1]
MNSRVLGLAGAIIPIIAFTTSTASPVQSATLIGEDVAEVGHNNGSLLRLNGESLPFGEGRFPVQEGDVIEFGTGFTDFTLLTTEPESTLWEVEIFPGDSTAFFNLEAYSVTVEAEERFSALTPLPSGQGNVIAFGFDPDNAAPVKLTAVDSEAKSTPEPTTLLGLAAVAALGISCRRKWGPQGD